MVQASAPTKLTNESLEEALKNIYVLYYKDNASNKLMKTFYFQGSLQDASHRARAHCAKMQFRYIRVEPLMAIFDVDESKVQLTPTRNTYS